MKIFAALRKRREFRRYARELPRRLFHDYGSRQSFTPAQIEVAVCTLKLDVTLIVHAYAMFLSRDSFDSIVDGLPASLPYEDARAEFLRYVPRGTLSSDFHESGIGGSAAGGWNSTFGSHDGGDP